MLVRSALARAALVVVCVLVSASTGHSAHYEFGVENVNCTEKLSKIEIKILEPLYERPYFLTAPVLWVPSDPFLSNDRYHMLWATDSYPISKGMTLWGFGFMINSESIDFEWRVFFMDAQLWSGWYGESWSSSDQTSAAASQDGCSSLLQSYDPPPPPPPPPSGRAPLLNVWGTAGLLAMLLSLGVIFVRRRKAVLR